MPTCVLLFAFSLGCWLLSGCADQPYVIKSAIQELPRPARSVSSAGTGLKVAVAPLEDAQTGRRCSGTRESFWGSETPFPVPVIGSNPGELATLMVIAALKHEKGWNAWLDKPGVTAPEEGPDVILNGEVLECAVVVESLFGVTTITASVEIVIRARNKADGSEVRVDLSTTVGDRVFWFQPEDAEAPLDAAFHDSLAKLISRTKVENQLLRLTSEQ